MICECETTPGWMQAAKRHLDYTGGGLYGESQLARHHELFGQLDIRQPALYRREVADAASQSVQRRPAALSAGQLSPLPLGQLIT